MTTTLPAPKPATAHVARKAAPRTAWLLAELPPEKNDAEAYSKNLLFSGDYKYRDQARAMFQIIPTATGYRVQ